MELLLGKSDVLGKKSERMSFTDPGIVSLILTQIPV